VEGKAAVLQHPHQKTMASHQRIPFVRYSVTVDAQALSFQQLLIPLMNGLGQEMCLPLAVAAYLSETAFFCLAAMPASL